MSKISIAFICDCLEMGGLERVCLNMLENIDRDKFVPIVYAFRGGTLLEGLKNLEIKVVIGSNKKPLSFHNGWTEEDENEKGKFVNILIDEMIKDKIQIALIFAYEDGVLTARRAGVSVVIEKVDGGLLLGKIKDKSLFDKIVCESKKIRSLILNQRDYFKCRKKQIKIIYNGIDLESFDRKKYNSDEERRKLGFHPDEFIIGYVGRIIAKKNLSLLIKSVKFLACDYKFCKFKLVIAGPDHGDLYNLQKLILKSNLSDKIIFTGLRKDIPNILSTFNVFAMTSKIGETIEGTPTAIIEAMAMGLPIVSTATGSIPEMIDRNGFLIDNPDPEIFAERLYVLIKNAQLRKKMGNRSLKLSKKYDIKKTMKNYEKIFVNCLEEKKHVS